MQHHSGAENVVTVPVTDPAARPNRDATSEKTSRRLEVLNCPADPNPDQADFDADGVGDAREPDVDGDGVNNGDDICPGTVLDPTEGLKKNRFAANGDGMFVDADGTYSGITVADTGGRSGTQIIDEAGLGKGHERFGITRSALEAWIASLAT